ncbi:hypothetical protein [Shimia sp.]|uniref:tetratricopeptide repeat protein n=1 Tax=Shimia sp. TaxID=1954381 RepID=UPI00329683E2
MRRFLLLIAACISTELAAGQVTFQSGEHDGFTRLVMELSDKSTSWEMDGEKRRYEIKILEDDVEFQTGSVFDRIGRNRLGSVLPDESKGTIQLKLNCDCDVRQSTFGDRYVIFDIRDPSINSVVANSESGNLQFGLGEIKLRPKKPLQFGGLRPQQLNEATAVVADNDAVIMAKHLNSAAQSVDKEARLAVTQTVLLKEIGRAATHSILEPIKNPPHPTERMARVKTPRPASDSMVKPQPPTDSGNMSAFNVLDQVHVQSSINGQANHGSSFCVPDDDLQIANWGETDDVVAQIAELRSRIYGEFDQVDEAAILSLARLYVFLTFGAEARSLLALHSSENQGLLIEMSHLVDGKEIDTGIFGNQRHCQGASTLWAVLAGQKHFNSGAVEAVVNTFNGLPRHLRELLGPRLSKKLSQMGEVEASDVILNAIERISEEPDPHVHLAQAHLSKAQGNSEEAVEALSKVTSIGHELTPTALIELIDMHMEEDLPTSGETVSLISAYSVEHKNSVLGGKIRRAHFLARVQAGEFEAALSVLREISGQDGEEMAGQLLDQFGNRIVATAGDFEFVEILVRNQLTDPGTFSNPVSLAMAERFLSMGFYTEAKKMLQSTSMMVRPEGRNILMAQIALAEGLPRQAEAALLGVQGVPAARLRIKARSIAGDHDRASQMLKEIGDNEGAVQEQWLASNWGELSSSGNNILAKVASLPETLPEPSHIEDPELPGQSELAISNDLISQSEKTRLALVELLDFYSVK